MLICGIKVSHDSAAAVVDGGRLFFSIEVEKLANNPRYSSLGQLERISEILGREGLGPQVIDQFVLDGWWPESGGDVPEVNCSAGPAVVHLDGTARLQTVDPTSTAIGRVLVEYETLTGIPVLCNTSANFSGRGFFPDLGSAARWGRIRHIWCDGTLYVDPAAGHTTVCASRSDGVTDER